MDKSIRLLIEGFFDDEIFNTDNDIKSNIEDLGRYYDYQVGDIYYLNKNPYAICCGDKSYFNDNKYRFCLLNDSKDVLQWENDVKLVKELSRFKFKYFELNSFNDFQHIDEDGFNNTQIIKNNYDISKFPAFKYCIELGDNVYLPALDELQMMYINKNKLGKYGFSSNHNGYWSSTQFSVKRASGISAFNGYAYDDDKVYWYCISPFFRLD